MLSAQVAQHCRQGAEERRLVCWAGRWRKRRPRAVACVERDLEELLSFFSVPKSHWKKVRTTNVIERRRTRPMSSFTNPHAVTGSCSV
jgi:transposase-like protein